MQPQADIHRIKNAIVWSLNFAYNTDLRRLRYPAFSKLLGQELAWHLFQDRSRLNVPDIEKRAFIDIQEGLRDFFENYLFPVINGKILFSEDLPEIYIPKRFVLWPHGDLRVLSQSTELSKENVIQRVITLLSIQPFPLTAFQRCEGCGWFFHKNRMTRFCTIRCNRRYNAQKQRGEKGSPEREQFNAYCRQRYHEKKRAKEKEKEIQGSPESPYFAAS